MSSAHTPIPGTNGHGHDSEALVWQGRDGEGGMILESRALMGASQKTET